MACWIELVNEISSITLDPPVSCSVGSRRKSTVRLSNECRCRDISSGVPKRYRRRVNAGPLIDS